MSELFGLDIKTLVSDAFSGQLVPITITREVQGGTYDPVDDRYEDGNGDEVLPTEQTFTSEGIMPANEGISAFQTLLAAAGETNENERLVLIIAKPLGTSPKTGDKLAIEGETYPITGIDGRDPAGASWTVKVEI